MRGKQRPPSLLATGSCSAVGVLLIAATCLFSVTRAYDDSVKECWDIRLQNETYFCYGAVEWPIS